MQLVADERILFTSPDSEGIFIYTPWICRGAGNRLLLSFDLGGSRMSAIAGPKAEGEDNPDHNQCRVMVSDDEGDSWRLTGVFGMLHARVFRAGKRLYLLGHAGKLLIAASEDNGETWSNAVILDDTCCYHQSGCSIDIHNGMIYLGMECPLPGKRWPNIEIRLMAARETDDLLRIGSWRFSNRFDLLKYDRFPNLLGMPFFPEGDLRPGEKDIRYSGPAGVLESNVVRIYDPSHLFFDPEDRTVMVILRVNSNLSNIGAILRGIDHPDGRLELTTWRTPQGGELFYVPFPGGQMKFHIVYDEISKLYWTSVSQTTDSLRRIETLPATRFNLPYNERNRLALYFSRNCYDWCFAGMVACRRKDKESRHYATNLIVGDDLLILSRSGDESAHCAHNGNLLTLHRVKRFRDLIY